MNRQLAAVVREPPIDGPWNPALPIESFENEPAAKAELPGDHPERLLSVGCRSQVRERVARRYDEVKRVPKGRRSHIRQDEERASAVKTASASATEHFERNVDADGRSVAL
jgi:hypothetical protein